MVLVLVLVISFISHGEPSLSRVFIKSSRNSSSISEIIKDFSNSANN